MKAHKIATVLHRDIYNPPKNTIWGRIELPVLQAAGNPGGVVDYVSTVILLRNVNGGLTSTHRSLPLMQRILIAGECFGTASTRVD